MGQWQEGGMVLSCADGISKAIELVLGNSEESMELPKMPMRFTSSPDGAPPECPDCGNLLIQEEGCVVCKVCGFSRCW